jgi:hypothetical protein
MSLTLCFSSPPPPVVRSSRRASLRREVLVPCQVVREDDFGLVAERTLDLSVDGMLVPIMRPVRVGDSVIVSFAIPGMWIDAKAVVSRVVQGRRPSDEGPAAGLLFVALAPAARAALAGHLHGRPPPLPRRGPLARLRRGEAPPQLADEAIMTASALAPSEAIDVDDVAEDVEEGPFGLGVLREVGSAWRRLAEEAQKA